VTRRGWILFAAMSAIWGVPYLLIKVAVDGMAPPVLVAGRTGIAALVLVPLAIHQGALRPALRKWRPLLAFTALEMAAPWLLLTDAERKLPSSLAGLLVAAVPMVAAVAAFALGERSALAPARLFGLAVGMVGVAFVVGVGREGGGDAWSVTEVLLVSVGYALAPFILDRHLGDVPPMGVVAASLGIVFVVYLPAAIVLRPEAWPPADSLWAVLGLAVLCTGIAFLVFFALIAEVGPRQATLITFVNPAVAVALGVTLLDEPLSSGLVVGFPFVLAGCWLAARAPRTPEQALATIGPH
jgi:drug/metabolite transporter (DMT)-like permease